MDEETGLTLSTMEPPRFRIGREKSDDYERNVQRMVAFTQLGPGADIKVSQAYELAGIEQPDEGEETLGATAMAELQQQQAQMQAEQAMQQQAMVGPVTDEDVPMQAGGEMPDERMDAFTASEPRIQPLLFKHLKGKGATGPRPLNEGVA